MRCVGSERESYMTSNVAPATAGKLPVDTILPPSRNLILIPVPQRGLAGARPISTAWTGFSSPFQTGRGASRRTAAARPCGFPSPQTSLWLVEGRNRTPTAAEARRQDADLRTGPDARHEGTERTGNINRKEDRAKPV